MDYFIPYPALLTPQAPDMTITTGSFKLSNDNSDGEKQSTQRDREESPYAHIQMVDVSIFIGRENKRLVQDNCKKSEGELHCRKSTVFSDFGGCELAGENNTRFLVARGGLVKITWKFRQPKNTTSHYREFRN
jgi:hypothetical protein